MRTAQEYKKLTIQEFTKAADIYESGNAGIYEMCKDDYPYIEAELEKVEYQDLLDCGCGSGAPEDLKEAKGVYAHMIKTQLQTENWKMA